MLKDLRIKLAKSLGVKSHDLQDWVDASIQRYDTSGINNSAYWAFDYRMAMEACNSWVYRCAMGNSQRAAAVPLRLYAKSKGQGSKRLAWSAKGIHGNTIKRLQNKGASSSVRRKAIMIGDDMVELQEHTILDMLSTAPNEWSNGYEMLTWVFLCLELTGNSYLYPQIDERLGRPSGLYPMLPQWVLVKPAPEGSNHLIDGYAYGQFTARERVTDFAADEIMHCRYPSVKNMYYGMGKVEAAWEILGLQGSQRRAYKALFDNGLQPGMIVSSESMQNDEQARATEGRMNAVFRGVRNAGKLMMMSGKVNVMPVASSPKDISTNESALEEIAAVFGYPITQLVSKDQGKANAESGEATWLKHTIFPMLGVVEQWLNQSLLPLFGDEVSQNCCLAFDSPIEEDSKILAESLSKQTIAGMITNNEARLSLGLEPYPGEDILRFNGIPLADVGNIPESKPNEKQNTKN